ncbi:MAG: helicase HerA-like domain-containing protein [Pseudomonadota bacterium]
MSDPSILFLGGGGADRKFAQGLSLRYANRHGLIAGATGTGKTVTLQIMAEGFSRAGVPVFLSDVKGDLGGLAKAGTPEHKLHPKLVERAETIGYDDFGYDAFPTVLWDLFGEQGHPVRATLQDLGPLTLARILDLSEAQEGVLNVCFRAASDAKLPIIDLKDLRAMLQEVAKKSTELQLQYGNVNAASVGAIQRRLLVLENQGADLFFGEPALDLKDLMRCAPDGQGHVNILAADRLMRSPRLYATFLFWMLSKLFDELPEVGDLDKPKLAFFFDEAHLLFDDAPKALVDKIEQVARLIRSKGVGVFFITQNPADVPDTVLGQLGSRVQHALRAYTPRDRKALRAAAETFRPNPEFDTEEAIPQLGVGEALVSTLEEKGAPSIVQRTLIRPPSSRIGPLEPEERKAVMAASPLAGVYDEAIDRHSAYEALEEQAARAAEEAARQLEEEEAAAERAAAEKGREREYRRAERIGSGSSRSSGGRSRSRRQSAGETFFKSMMRRVGSKLGDRLLRSIFKR